MSLILSWLLFPAILVLLCLGAGLLTERATGGRLPGPLLLPLGLATVIVATQFATKWDATAELATPLVVVLAVAGLVLARARLRALKLDRWALAAAVGVFAVFAAPIVLSGQATFAGYNLNGEPSIHFIGVDRLMEHGRSLAGLAPSSYELCLANFFGSGYPSGGQTALGGVKPLVGQDVAWVYQPFIAFLVAMGSLALYSIVTPLVKRPAYRALVVFIAAQPALVYAYSLQGSIKEIAAATMVMLLVALVAVFVRERGGLRSVVPLAVGSAAGLAVINVGIVPWLGLILLAALVLSLLARPRMEWKLTAKQALALLALAAVLSYPALSVSETLFNVAGDQLTAQSDITPGRGLGNLIGPLHKVQVVGIWLIGDYRTVPAGTRHDATYLLLGVALISGLIGLNWAVRRRSLGPLLYVAVAAIAGSYVIWRGSPWADGKALMIVSPAVLLAIMLGPVALLERGLKVAGLLLAGAVSLGVLWSNALAYHDVNLAPRERLVELEKVGQRVAGQGPTVYLEWEEYGKHFLRKGDPEGRTEPCQRRYLPFRSGELRQMGFTSDLDEQTLEYLLHFRTIVLRRSPALSRPPSIYRRVYANSDYEVWQRPRKPRRRVVEHLSLGSSLRPSTRPRCQDVKRLLVRARRIGARIAYVERPRSTILIPARTTHPPIWTPDPLAGHVLIPAGPGRVEDSVRLRAAGQYSLWLGGSFGRGYTVSVDGKPVGRVSYSLSGRDQYEKVGDLTLSPGRHVITLLREGGDLRPGNGGLIRSLGPVILQPQPARPLRVKYVDPSRARDLCRRNLDWVEVVRT